VWIALAFALSAIPGACLAASDAAPAYHLASAIPVQDASGKRVARLELLEDARLTPEIRAEWRGADAAMSFAEPSQEGMWNRLCDSIRRQPLRGAELRLTTERGRVLDRRTFERELGEIAPIALYGAGRAVFAVTIDYGIGFGSYAGPTTRFAEVSGGRLHWIASYDAGSGKPTEIRVESTLKNDWQTVTGSAGLDILAVHCRPASADDAEFEIVYERYAFDGARWVRTERRERGLWEEDQEFPPLDRFPR